jgi:hypothetical protein
VGLVSFGRTGSRAPRFASGQAEQTRSPEGREHSRTVGLCDRGAVDSVGSRSLALSFVAAISFLLVSSLVGLRLSLDEAEVSGAAALQIEREGRLTFVAFQVE